jgi:photosystem II stability/assembly factor-like uncharacterized protein
VEVGEERTRRAVAWIGVAAVGTLVAGVVYLRPSLAPPTAATPAARARVAGPANGWRLVSASFADANHGTVQLYSSGPAPATTFLTSDGGKTWRMAARAPRNGYAWAGFIDAQTVVAQTVTNLGPANAGPVTTRISYDAGRTWRPLADPRRSPGLGLPAFLDPEHAWWIDRPSSPDPHAPVTLWRTTDGGRSWHEPVASGLPASGFPGQLVFTDPLHGMLIFTAPDRTASASATSDGGETWRTAETPEVPLQGTRLLSWTILRRGQRLLWWLLTVPDTTVTAGGALVSPQGGSSIDYTPFVSISDDGGQTWSQPRAGPSIVQPAYGYIGLFPRVDTRGRLLMVDDRRLWVSDDGGTTWAARLMQAPADLRPAMLVSAVPGALFAMAAQTGPVGMVTPSTPLTLIRSTDDGAHWSAVALPRSPAP